MTVNQHHKNCAGELVLLALGSGFDVDAGVRIDAPDLTIGHEPNVTPLGSWQIIVKRTAKPA